MRSLTRMVIVLVCLSLVSVYDVSQAQSNVPDQAILALDWSPDGSRIALGRQNGAVEIVTVGTGESVLLPDSGADSTRVVVWSPDSSQLASGSADHLVRIWDVASGDLQFTLDGHPTAIDAIAWNPSGSELASASGDSPGVVIWNAATGEYRLTYPGSGVREIVWDAVGLTMLALDQEVTLVANVTIPGESVDARLVVLLEDQGAAAMDWSRGFDLVARANNEHAIEISAPTSFGTPITALEGHTDVVMDVAWQPVGSQLASVSVDGTLRVWDYDSSQEVDVVQQDSALYALSWSPDGTQIAYGGDDGELFWYKVSDMTESTPSPNASSPLLSADFEGDVSQWTRSEGWRLLEEAGNHFFEAGPGNRRFQDDLALQTPLDLSGATNPVLRYRSAHELAQGASGRVQVSADGGATWIDIQTLNDSTDLAWVEQEIDLSDFAGQTILLRFHYEWVDLSRGPFGVTLPSRNWRVDDVRVEG